MSIVVALTVGLIIWIVAWTFGFKSVDAFFVTVFITLVAAGARIARPAIREQLGKD